MTPTAEYTDLGIAQWEIRPSDWPTADGLIVNVDVTGDPNHAIGVHGGRSMNITEAMELGKALIAAAVWAARHKKQGATT